MDQITSAQEMMQEMMAKARAAQKIYETFTQEQCDACARAAAKVVYDHAEELAKMAQEETQMGTYEAKLAQNTGGITWMWGHMKGKKSRGLLRYDEENRIYEYARPMGVVGCVAPTTAPVITPAHTALCCFKVGNALIVSPHPKGKKTTAYYCDLVRKALVELGAPADLIQCVAEPTRETRELVMTSVDVIVAVGGANLVKLAYSSGKPSFGVGQGNGQYVIDRGSDLKDTAYKIFEGRVYNNGLPCTSTQFVHAPKEELPALIEEWEKLGGYMVPAEKIDDLRLALFPEGKTSRALVGESAEAIAAAAGIEIPEGTKALGFMADGLAPDDVLRKEKLFVVTGFNGYDTWEEGVAAAEANLQLEGAGHSSAVITTDPEHVKYAAEHISVCRLVVNQITSHSAGGTQRCRYAPTGAVGCGSWGGNSISENLDYHHLMNIVRVAYEMPESVVLSDEEIWAE